MMLKVGKLIAEREPPACVSTTDTVRSAAKIMHRYDYSQLPVVEENNHIVGLFTEQALTKMFALGATHEFLDERVEQWMKRHPAVVGSDRSIYDVARMLVDTYAVVVAKQGEPIGIITDYDIAVFMADWSNGIALVEEIEQRLRGYIERVYSTHKALNDALSRALGEENGKPRKKYTELTLSEHVQIIIAKANWPAFKPYFKSETAFMTVLGDVRPIRNQIVHFRGQLTDHQVRTLQEAQQWLQERPRVPVRTKRGSNDNKPEPHSEDALS